MSPKDQSQRIPQGFAGLVELVSDGVAESLAISQEGARAVEAAKKAEMERNKKGVFATAFGWIRTAFENQVAPQHRKAVIVVGIIAALVVVVSLLSKGEDNSTPTTAGGFPLQPTAAAGTQTTQSPRFVPSEIIDNSEAVPPIGTDVVLTRQQIRYCLAESIRLDGGKAYLEKRTRRDPTRFNAEVQDYNNRCGRFRYPVRIFDDVKTSVESQRDQLLRDGEQRESR